MSAWQHRCPEGHTSLESRRDGYRCHSCDVIYEGEPFDATEVDAFPVERDVPYRETGDREDVLREVIEHVDSHDRGYVQTVHLPDRLGSGKQIGAVLQHMAKDGLVKKVGYSSGRDRWQPTEAGRAAADGDADLWPDSDGKPSTDGTDAVDVDVALSDGLGAAVEMDTAPTAKLVYLLLQDVEKPLTTAEIADVLGVHHDTARRSVNDLEDLKMAVCRTRPHAEATQRPLEWAHDESVFPDDAERMGATYYQRIGAEGVADD